jgi:uncharacterized protein YndB with AHSA1/START domain
MGSIKVAKHIAAPPDRVFEAATDIPKWAERMGGIERVEMLTDGPVDVGTKFRETRIMFKREATEEMEVTAFDPPRSYAVGCENHGCRYHSEMTFTPNGSGTDVELTFEATPLTAVAKLMSAMMSPLMKKMGEVCGKDLDDLKASIESG